MAAPTATVGRYVLYDEIASGGMAAVHLGRLLGPVGFARTVAIKRLLPCFARDPEFVAMFLDEARLAARIRHPNVVSTLDVVATERELFVVMDFVLGDSLARLLRAARDRGERAPLPVAAAIMVNVLHGLHAAHEAKNERGAPLGLVHRDVSPQNVLVGADGAAHVIDFGVAKAAGRAQITRDGQIKGKLAYMSPEQLRGGAVDRRADVFGASILFWEAITGRRLFEGDDDGVIYGKVLRAEVEAPSVRAGDMGGIGAVIDAIVMRGLARDPADRFATARDMALAIEGALPLAPPSHVGLWVEHWVGPALEGRRARIAAIESATRADEEEIRSVKSLAALDPARDIPTAPGGRSAGEIPSVVVPGQDSEPHDADWAQPTNASLVTANLAPPRARVRRRSIVTMAGAALLFGAALVQELRPAARSSDVRIAAPPPPETPLATLDALPPPAPEPSAIEPLVTPPPEPAPVVAKPPRSAPHRRSAAPVIKPSVAAAPPPDCDPPYTLDADGTKRYKRQCASW